MEKCKYCKETKNLLTGEDKHTTEKIKVCFECARKRGFLESQN